MVLIEPDICFPFDIWNLIHVDFSAIDEVQFNSAYIVICPNGNWRIECRGVVGNTEASPHIYVHSALQIGWTASGSKDFVVKSSSRSDMEKSVFVSQHCNIIL